MVEMLRMLNIIAMKPTPGCPGTCREQQSWTLCGWPVGSQSRVYVREPTCRPKRVQVIRTYVKHHYTSPFVGRTRPKSSWQSKLGIWLNAKSLTGSELARAISCEGNERAFQNRSNDDRRYRAQHEAVLVSV